MPITGFIYSAYIQLLQLIVENGYTIVDYHHFNDVINPCILRHDIDFDVEKALDLARLEVAGLPRHKARSTYFVLLTSDFYNVFSKTIHKMLRDLRVIVSLSSIDSFSELPPCLCNSLYSFWSTDFIFSNVSRVTPNSRLNASSFFVPYLILSFLRLGCRISLFFIKPIYA